MTVTTTLTTQLVAGVSPSSLSGATYSVEQGQGAGYDVEPHEPSYRD